MEHAPKVVYHPPTIEQLLSFRSFLQREAKGTFGSQADDGTVLESFVSTYDTYPRYGRLRDFSGDYLRLGDRFFRLAELTNLFLAATHLDHDRFGLVGPIRTKDSVAIIDIEMSDQDLDNLVHSLQEVIQSLDRNLVFEFDWVDFTDKGPSISPTKLQDTTASQNPSDSVRNVLTRKSIGITDVELVKLDDGFSLNVDGDFTRISEAEATVFFNCRESRLMEWVLGPSVERGVSLGDLVSKGLRQNLEAVFMDQSSFRKRNSGSGRRHPYSNTLL